MPAEESGPSSSTKKAKRKLDFEADTGPSMTKKKNVLNLPYSDSESEPERENVQAKEEVEYSMEPMQNYEGYSTHEEGETSKKTMTEETKTIKKLKQQTVLERVIKQRYETLSDNFAKTHEAFRQLALKRVKEKKKMKKIVKENNKWWRITRQLKIKNKLLKDIMVNRSPLQILAETAEFLGND